MHPNSRNPSTAEYLPATAVRARWTTTAIVLVVAATVLGSAAASRNSNPTTGLIQQVQEHAQTLAAQNERIERLEAALPPVGSILAWHKDLGDTPPLSGFWMECNGSTVDCPGSPYHGKPLPNLNGERLFLRGSNKSSSDSEKASWKRLFVSSVQRKFPDYHHDVMVPLDGPSNALFTGKWDNNPATGVIFNHGAEDDVRPANIPVVYIIRVK